MKKRQELSEYLMVKPQDVLKILEGGYVLLGSDPITIEEVSSLQEEIKFLEKTRIWAILTATVCDKAKQIMFEKAITFDDMKTGKAMLFNVDLMKKMMTQIKSIKIAQPKKKKNVQSSAGVV